MLHINSKSRYSGVQMGKRLPFLPPSDRAANNNIQAFLTTLQNKKCSLFEKYQIKKGTRKTHFWGI